MNNSYRFMTTEELIKIYAFEKTIFEDEQVGFRLIKEELKRRFKTVLDMLDDKQTIENPEGTFKYLLGE